MTRIIIQISRVRGAKWRLYGNMPGSWWCHSVRRLGTMLQNETIFEEKQMKFARSVYRFPWKLHQEYDLPFCQCAHRCNIGKQKIPSWKDVCLLVLISCSLPRIFSFLSFTWKWTYGHGHGQGTGWVGGVWGGALWANRPSNQKRKSPKKLRPIAQNSGHVALRSEVSKEFLLSW